MGGKQSRPDSGYSRAVLDPQGRLISHVPEGSRKDLRNAVEAAHKAHSWTSISGHQRAQVLYYLAENLEVRAPEWQKRLSLLTGQSAETSALEVELSLKRIFSYAAYADKFEGTIHQPPLRGAVLAIPEALGVMGIICPDERPLLSMFSLLLPAIALGNRIILIPSERYPLMATDLYQVLDTSDVPAGVINIVTGPSASLAKTLAEHLDVEALWSFRPELVSMVEKASVGNLKQVWAPLSLPNWADDKAASGRDYLRKASQIKNIWIPYGE
ncbi:MAG: aldehyde dehydrogenase family protein [Deinococcales bacterium]